MFIILLILGLFLGLVIYSCCKVSSECSRWEEENGK